MRGNEEVMKLTGCELQAIQWLNGFVIAWFICNQTVDSPITGVKLIQALMVYDEEGIRSVRLKWMGMPAPHHSVFYRLDALPVAQPTASKHWR